MLATRLTCARAWSAAILTGFRLPYSPHPTSFLNKASYTMHVGNRVRWQKVGAVNGSSYSQSIADATIAAVNPQPDRKMLKVRWEGGGEDMYPYLWLRDNCQCTNCFHPVSLSRRVMLKDLRLSLDCADIKVCNGGEHVKVQWTDGHLGIHNAQWLHERAFREPRHERPDQQCRLKREYWGSELKDDIPRASFPDLIGNNAALLSFLEKLEIFGVVLVSEVPNEMDQIKHLTKRIGRMKKTHYGETFDVVNKADPNNLAYTADSLDLHTDLPFMEHKPGIQLLHCIKQFTGDGGDTLLRDGFATALKLRTINLKYYDTLVQTMIDFVDVGIEGVDKFHACWRAPVIELDAGGDIQSVNWNQMTRDSRFHVSSEAAALWYTASLAFRDLLYDANGLVTLKLQPGDLLVFDNLRVLHGRQGYRAEQGERLLQGGYWEWDLVRSLRRVLHKEMAA